MTNKTDLNRELAEALDWGIAENCVDLFVVFPDETMPRLFDPLHDDAQCMRLAKQHQMIVNFYNNTVVDHLGNEISRGKTVNEAIIKALIKLLRGQP